MADTPQEKVDVIRGLVRPIVTFLVILTLAFIVIWLVIKFADLDMAKIVLAGFMALVGALTGFWFASRQQTPTK
jgi:hypothetical protein